jgi:3-methyl-2-oxobutanoate hydroxymethyltransferase
MADRMTVPSIRARKRRLGAAPLAMVTAYDTPTAACADRAGVDMLLVGDSLGHVVLGYDTALRVSVADMAHHVAAVARAEPRALVVADLPWLSYHTGWRDAVRNAATLVRAGADAVKLEGCRPEIVEAVVQAEIPVMAHLGVTPQSVRMVGVFEVHAPEERYVGELVASTSAMAASGCFAAVLSCVPGQAAAKVTDSVDVPTVGFGSGPRCDGQVLILHDLVGLGVDEPPSFARRYATTGKTITDAVAAYCEDVRGGRFPPAEETAGPPADRTMAKVTSSGRGGASR